MKLKNGCRILTAGLREEVAKLKEKAERQDNISVAAELRIIQIPTKRTENLYTVFEQICSAIDVSTPSFLTVFRMKNKVNGNGNLYNDAPIIVKLSSPYERNFFMRSLAAFRRKNRRYLQLQDNGIRYYVNENLTWLNSTIMRAATKFKKEIKIAMG